MDIELDNTIGTTSFGRGEFRIRLGHLWTMCPVCSGRIKNKKSKDKKKREMFDELAKNWASKKTIDRRRAWSNWPGLSWRPLDRSALLGRSTRRRRLATKTKKKKMAHAFVSNNHSTIKINKSIRSIRYIHPLRSRPTQKKVAGWKTTKKDDAKRLYKGWGYIIYIRYKMTI